MKYKFRVNLFFRRKVIKSLELAITNVLLADKNKNNVRNHVVSGPIHITVAYVEDHVEISVTCNGSSSLDIDIELWTLTEYIRTGGRLLRFIEFLCK